MSYREKEHDLETKYAMLNRELRKMMEIEGKSNNLFCKLLPFVNSCYILNMLVQWSLWILSCVTVPYIIMCIPSGSYWHVLSFKRHFLLPALIHKLLLHGKSRKYHFLFEGIGLHPTSGWYRFLEVQNSACIFLIG